jgi:hypothetical protein
MNGWKRTIYPNRGVVHFWNDRQTIELPIADVIAAAKACERTPKKLVGLTVSDVVPADEIWLVQNEQVVATFAAVDKTQRSRVPNAWAPCAAISKIDECGCCCEVHCDCALVRK